MNTINIEIKSNPQWKSHIFKKTSEIVCEKIQHLFKEVLHCSTRVSVEYVFNKTSKDKIERLARVLNLSQVGVNIIRIIFFQAIRLE